MAGSPITASVGAGGANRKADVEYVQRALNGAPVTAGGPPVPLDADGLCGAKTVAAIMAFQQKQFGWKDGRVDVGGQTLARLMPYAGAAAPAPTPPPPGSQPATPQPPVGTRAAIVAMAMSQTAGQYGVVSDLDTVHDPLLKKTVRRGWRHLQGYFDEAVAGWTPQHWNDPAILAGVQVPGKRIPQPGTGGVSWCGIFATWCVRRAGVETKWVAGMGPTGLFKVAGSVGMQPGDIAVEKGDTVHHYVVASIAGDQIVSVNGNSDAQSILVKPKTRAGVWYYYRTV